MAVVVMKQRRYVNMAAMKGIRSTQRSRSGAQGIIRQPGPTRGNVEHGAAGAADVAAKQAWNAVKEVVRAGKVQPVTAARATGKAVRNVAKSGAKQSGVAAETLARALEEILVSAVSEARTAAQAARDAAREVERAVRTALKAIRIAVRKRGLLTVNEATRARPRKATRKTRGKRPRARSK
jgi:hypothetical protein